MRGGDVTAAARCGGACARWRQLAAEAAQTAVCRRRARGGSSHGKRGARDSPGAAVTTYNEQHDDRRRRAGRRVHQYVEYEYQTVPEYLSQRRHRNFWSQKAVQPAVLAVHKRRISLTIR